MGCGGGIIEVIINAIMLPHFRSFLRPFFSTSKAYYPFFLAEDYTPLFYSPYYVPPPHPVPKGLHPPHRQRQHPPGQLHHPTGIPHATGHLGQGDFYQVERVAFCGEVEHGQVFPH